jgi:plastin-1
VTPEELLVRWINFHLKAAGQEPFVKNLGKDLVDSKALFYVLNQLDKEKCPLDHMNEEDLEKRAEQMILNADALGVAKMIDAHDFIKGNYKVNMIFVSEIFNTKHGMEELKQEEKEAYDCATIEDDDIEGTREERSFRLWINSLGIEDVFINNLFAECSDGQVLLKVIHKIDNTVVEWNRVEKNANSIFKIGINC